MYKSTKNPKLTNISRVLRSNMTPEEKHLWYDFLKKLPLTVHRQKVIGKYVVDFYLAEPKIVIELDGSQHFKHKHAEADKIRDAYLESLGNIVLRYTNAQINQSFIVVCQSISGHIEDRINFNIEQ